jgi:hypothetical protein
MYDRTRTAGFGAEVERRVMLGTYALSAGYYDAFYGKAQRVRTLIIRDFEAAYAGFDVLLSPTAPSTAFALGAKTADPLTMYLNDVCTIPCNLSGDPAMSVPFGVGDDGARGRAGDGRCLDEVTLFAAAPSKERSHELARRLGDGDRARGALRAGHRDQALLLLPEQLRRRAQRQHLSDLPRTARVPAGAQRGRGRDGHAPVGPRLRRGALLSSPGRTTSTRTSRRTTRSPSTTCRPPIRRARPPSGSGSASPAHMDTGKSLHVGGSTGRIHGATHSLVDYNRAGIPLIEIVTKPMTGAGERAPLVAAPTSRSASLSSALESA